ncbi:hypothetical protein J6590_000365 [Homalodisca vitripennis]|nr:hypothetical protein J6590_000365 [Homalodisca vitripennis]
MSKLTNGRPPARSFGEDVFPRDCRFHYMRSTSSCRPSLITPPLARAVAMVGYLFSVAFRLLQPQMCNYCGQVILHQTHANVVVCLILVPFQVVMVSPLSDR